VTDAARIRDFELAQLEEAGELAGLEADAESIKGQLASLTPWRGIHTIEGALARARERYLEVRRRMLGQQSAAAEAAQARIKDHSGLRFPGGRRGPSRVAADSRRPCRHHP